MTLEEAMAEASGSSQIKCEETDQEKDVPDGKPGKLLRCPQEGCGKVYQSSPGYRYHLKSHTTDPRPHLCKCCMKKFKSANGLKYHLRKAHHIEPVLSKLKDSFEQTSPNGRNSLSSEEDSMHYNSYIEGPFQRPFVNGNYVDHATSLQSPVGKSPLAMSSPPLKSNPMLPSPLARGGGDGSPFLGNGCAMPSPFGKVDRYGSHFYDRLNGEYLPSASDYPRRYSHDLSRHSSSEFAPFCARSSLSEYTQQCQQENEDLRQQCQRLSSSDGYVSAVQRQASLDYPYPGQRSSCDLYSCRAKAENYTRSCSADFSGRMPSHFPYTNGGKDLDLNDSREYFRNLPSRISGYPSPGCSLADYSMPCEGGEYPASLANSSSNNCMERPSPSEDVSRMPPCDRNDCQFETTRPRSCEYLSRPGGPFPEKLNNRDYNGNMSAGAMFKTPVSVDSMDASEEQTVPNVVMMGEGSSPQVVVPGSEGATTKLKTTRGRSDSSNETELSDCVFQNDTSMHSPVVTCAPDAAFSTYSATVMSPTTNTTDAKQAPVSSVKQSKFFDNVLNRTPPKPFSMRRSSKSKPIPPALVLSQSPLNAVKKEDKDVPGKRFLSCSRLAEFADFATSPRSPLVHSPFPFSLTPALLAIDSTPDWLANSPLKKMFNFSDKPFLATPTIARALGNGTSDSPVISSASSFPPSPSLDNVPTPSFWPTQVLPTPVWLCFLKGCLVKFEQDDKEFRTSEDIADFCTTPGGRRRDNMNFYTSGMKIVGIRDEKPSVNTARDMVQLTFEQIIPGTQRLVAICPNDHPFYIKHKGWSSPNPTESMARYGIQFRTLHVHDIVVLGPQSKLSQTPGITLSPSISASGPQVFTFSGMETSSTLSSASKRPDPVVTAEKMPSSGKATSSYSFAVKTEPGAELIPNAPPAGATECEKSSDGAVVGEKAIQSSAASTSVLKSLEKPQGAKHGGKTAPRKRRKKQEDGQPEQKRPMNGFMLFAKSMRIELTKSHPGKDNRAISKILGERWKELNDAKREEFSRTAKELADERMKLNPDCWKRKHKKEKEPSGLPGLSSAACATSVSAASTPASSRAGTPPASATNGGAFAAGSCDRTDTPPPRKKAKSNKAKADNRGEFKSTSPPTQPRQRQTCVMSGVDSNHNELTLPPPFDAEYVPFIKQENPDMIVLQ